MADESVSMSTVCNDCDWRWVLTVHPGAGAFPSHSQLEAALRPEERVREHRSQAHGEGDADG